MTTQAQIDLIKQVVERNRAAGIAVVYPPNIPNLLPIASGKLFVTDLGIPGISIWPVGTRGDIAPSEVITGTNTKLAGPFGIYNDAVRSLIWVANPTPARIVAFPNNGTGGNLVPSVDIEGASVGFSSPADVAIDSTGKIYVADESGSGVFVFAAVANGNVAPLQQITVGGDLIAGIDVDGSGNIYCADKTTNSILVFAPGATGAAVPIRTISGSTTSMDPTATTNALAALRLGPDGAIWVVLNGSTPGVTQILRFTLTANGDIPPISTLTLQIGGGSSTAAVDGIAFDNGGNVIWPQISGAPSCIGFNLQTDVGSAAPEGLIVGGSTTLSVPWSVAVSNL